MVQVKIVYHKESDTFIATDDFANSITFKADRVDDPAAVASKGNSLGPMLSLLMACGACSGIDVVHILAKQRQALTGLSISIKGQRAEGVTPALWKEVDLQFALQGALDNEKVAKAIELSIEKYCSVLATLRLAGAAVTYGFTVN